MAEERKRPAEPETRRTKGTEPQSYGSERDWLYGTTGQTVEGTPHRTSRQDEAFYDPSHDAKELSASEAPALQSADPAPAARSGRATGPASRGGKKIAESNSTRQTYFKKRDYD
jgi:hypothetical protein